MIKSNVDIDIDIDIDIDADATNPFHQCIIIGRDVALTTTVIEKENFCAMVNIGLLLFELNQHMKNESCLNV